LLALEGSSLASKCNTPLLTTGFKGCKDNPTLMDWNSFDGQSSAKIIKKEKQDVIVIDLNMTKDLVIGDKL